MKRLVIRAVFFASVVILVFGSICGFELWCELNAYRGEVRAPAEASVLVCNDSQAAMCVNPDVDSAFFNFSAHGRMMDQAYLALIDLFAANPGRFRTVAVDISPVAAVDAFDKSISDMGYSSQYYLLHWLHFRENRRDMTGQLAVFRDNMVGRRWRLFWRFLRGRGGFTSSICGRFTPVMESCALTSPDNFRRQFRSRARMVNDAPALTADAPVFSCVDDIIRLARAHGAEPVIMTTPWHSELLNACRPEKLAAFTKVVSDYAKRNGCRYVDFLRTPFPDACWYDAQHLNLKGSKAFTPMLRSLEFTHFLSAKMRLTPINKG